MAQKANFFLIKIILFQIVKKAVFLEFSKNSLNGFYLTLVNVFVINQDVIKVYNDRNIKVFYQGFVDIALEVSRVIKKTEKYHLVLEMAMPHLKSCFLFVTFSNSYLIICICQVQLSKIFGITQTIEQFINQGQWVAIVDCQIVELLIIYIQIKATVFFLNK